MEVAGLTIGGVALASLFNSCVDDFKLIRLGANFGSDFEKCLLQITVAQNRFIRWGDICKINHDPSSNTANPSLSRPSESEESVLLSLLQHIKALFHDVQLRSQKYPGISALGSDELTRTNKECYDTLQKQAGQRQRRTKNSSIAAWVLYRKEDFDSLIHDLVGFIDSLEKLFPIQRQLQDEYARDMEAFEGVVLDALRSAAQNTDKTLEEMATRKQDDISLKDRARLMKGDMVGVEWKGETCLPTRSGDTFVPARVVAQDDTKVATGNIYGIEEVRAFWG